MTTPTQAQIEAAAKAAFSASCSDDDGYDWEDYIPVAEAALTAAAQVGEKTGAIQIADAIKASVQAERRATIERCAEVVHEAISNGEEPVAALRKLKDS